MLCLFLCGLGGTRPERLENRLKKGRLRTILKQIKRKENPYLSNNVENMCEATNPMSEALESTPIFKSKEVDHRKVVGCTISGNGKDLIKKGVIQSAKEETSTK